MKQLVTQTSRNVINYVDRTAPLVKLSTLAPCPFCGGEAAIGRYYVEKITGTGAPSGVCKDWTFVWCRDCLARGPHCNDEAHARAAWNGEVTP